MQIIDAPTLARLLAPPALVAALKTGLADPAPIAPLRHAHTLAQSDLGRDTLLLMPAWDEGKAIGVKLVTVMTAKPRAGGTVQSVYLLLDGASGAPVAVLDGETLTARRTAAQSALAAQFLAREDAAHLLMVGVGALSQAMVEAHVALRPGLRVALWGRKAERVAARAEALAAAGIAVDIVEDLAGAVGRADIICCATTAREPVVRGEWLRPGQHLDLVGGFRPDMREIDDAAVLRARLFVDTLAGCLAEAGDLVQPLAAGTISRDAIVADLPALCRGDHGGRGGADEITVFKSVGTALADLVAAQLAQNGLTQHGFASGLRAGEGA